MQIKENDVYFYDCFKRNNDHSYIMTKHHCKDNSYF